VLTRNKILHFFEGKPNKIISGSELARHTGITRAMVSKHVRALQAMGLPIKSHQRTGYSFLGVPDFSLSRTPLSKALSKWATPHHSWTSASTQVQAKQAAAQGIPEGHFWMAETQSQGRGRLGRVWDSSFGGLWLSLLLRPRLSPAEVAPLSLVAGLSLAESIEKSCGIDVRLKWPNDIVVKVPSPFPLPGERVPKAGEGNYRKLAGILTEMSGEMDRTAWVVLGVGLNVNNPLPKSLAEQAVSLSQLTGKPLERRKILEAFLIRFRERYLNFQTKGFSSCAAAYWERYYAPNAPVRLKTSQGIVSGIARGVDPRGAFIVESGRSHASARRSMTTWFEGEIVL